MSLLLSMMFAISAQAQNLNDYSILLPLPDSLSISQLLTPASRGIKGELIPEDYYADIPELIPEESNSSVFLQRLKVIAIRIDPCFVEGHPPLKCKKQIRMVWQPLVEINNEWSTRDASVHTFYELTDAEWSQLIVRWPASKPPTPDTTLQIHPEILKYGYNSSYWNSLKSLVLEHCGEANLTRLTLMNVFNGEQVWAFLGFDFINGKRHSLPIARLNHTTQGVIMMANNNKEFVGGMRPSPAADADLSSLTEDSILNKSWIGERQLYNLAKRMNEYENPNMHNPGTLDCVSCHISQSVKLWAKINFKNWNWIEIENEMFVSRWNTKPHYKPELQTNNFRAFGYFGKNPAISQRVINETAKVAEALSPYIK